MTVMPVDMEISPNSALIVVDVRYDSESDANSAMLSMHNSMGSIDGAQSVLSASNLVLRSPPTLIVVELRDVIEPESSVAPLVLGILIPSSLVLAALCICRKRGSKVPMGLPV